MKKMITALCVLAVAVGSMMAASLLKVPNEPLQPKSFKIDVDQKLGGPAVGQTSSVFYDQSLNGFGWLGRDLNAIAYDPAADMFGSFYRQKVGTTGGHFGGMVGMYDPAEANPFVWQPQTIQSQVANQWNLRYCTVEFGSGYFYGAGTSLYSGWPDSPGIFGIFDPNSGWKVRKISEVDFDIIRPIICSFKQGNEYVVKIMYTSDPGDTGFMDEFTGRTTTPTDINSWVFTKSSTWVADQYTTPRMQIQDNGVGIIVQPHLTAEGETGYYMDYKWTSDYGQTWNPADSWNRIKPEDVSPFITTPPQTVGTTTLVELANMGSFVEMTMEKNGNVHLLMDLGGGDTPGSTYRRTDSGMPIDGYYHLALNWTGSTFAVAPKANFIAQRNGWDQVDFPEVDGERFYHKYANNVRTNIGLALNAEGTKQVIYAGWPDRPKGCNIRTNAPKSGVSCTDTQSENFIADGFFTYSEDNGTTWRHAIDSSWTAYNITNSLKTNLPRHENSFTIAKKGKLVPAANGLFDLVTYAGFQTPDWDIPGGAVANVEDFQMNLYVNRITANLLTGFDDIETEDVTNGKAIELAQNYPNPFNPTTAINFNLQSAANVKLSVFNAQGQEVANLINAKMTSGAHTANFNAANLNSGVYFYKLSVDGQSAVKKMVLTK